MLQRIIIVVMAADHSLSLMMTASLSALENVFDGWTFNGIVTQNNATIGTVFPNEATIGTVILNEATIGTVILNEAQRSEESVYIIRVLQRIIIVVLADHSLSLMMTASWQNRPTDY